jgi:uncharacterized protein
MKLLCLLATAAWVAASPVMAQAPAAGRGAPGAGQTPAASAPAAARSSGTSQAPAGAAAQAAPVDPAKAAAVRQLLQVTDSGKLGEELVSLVTTQVRQAMGGAITQPDRLQQFMDAFSKGLGSRVTPQQINDAVIPIYASHLSLEDLEGLVAFYQSPAGQHVIKALPLIIQESQNAGASMTRTAAVDTLRSMTTDYPEVQQVLPKTDSPAQGGSGQQQQAPAPSLRQIPSTQ